MCSQTIGLVSTILIKQMHWGAKGVAATDHGGLVFYHSDNNSDLMSSSFVSCQGVHVPAGFGLSGVIAMLSFLFSGHEVCYSGNKAFCPFFPFIHPLQSPIQSVVDFLSVHVWM